MKNKKKRLSIKEASELLELPEQTLRVFIQNGKFSEFACYNKDRELKALDILYQCFTIV